MAFGQSAATAGREAAIVHARSLLRLDAAGRPACGDARAVVRAVVELGRTRDEAAIQEILVDGFLRGSDERCEEHVAPGLRRIDGGRFHMGTDAAEAGHFCGEVPRHDVRLTPYLIGRHAVTNELYALLDERRAGLPPHERRQPVVDLTWYDATLFAMWMGCRLPSEAEWELACGAGSDAQWCCADPVDLGRHAWYSETSRGVIHDVGTREPNANGLFDMHGNVWEWCRDVYDQDFYARSAPADPVAIEGPTSQGGDGMDRVCRGGSMHSLAEMCRTRYRFHEPPDFWAFDLGFRLVRNLINDGRMWLC
jgi:formylglycine-generating enzyme required for sulfatase activity